MHRFFADPQCAREGQTLRLSKELLRHLRAARIRPGEKFVVIVEGQGFEATLAPDVKDRAALGSAASLAGTGPVQTELWLGLPKQDGLEQVVDGATELGVCRIRLVRCARSVRGEISERQLERLQKIAQAAAEVAGRARLPEIVPPVPPEALPLLPPDTRAFVLWEERAGASLGALLLKEPPPATAILFIGPEGGLEAQEVRTLEGRGFEVAGLGPRILRARTAPLAALSVVQGIWGDLGRASP